MENNTDRELSFGEKAVGLTFNPSGDEKVNKAKKLMADALDLLQEVELEKSDYGKIKPNWEANVFRTNAFNKIVEYAKANGDPIPSNDKEANDYITSKQAEQLQEVQTVAAAKGDPVPVDASAAADYAKAHNSTIPDSTPAPAAPAPSTPGPSRVDTNRP